MHPYVAPQEASDPLAGAATSTEPEPEPVFEPADFANFEEDDAPPEIPVTESTTPRQETLQEAPIAETPQQMMHRIKAEEDAIAHRRKAADIALADEAAKKALLDKQVREQRSQEAKDKKEQDKQVAAVEKILKPLQDERDEITSELAALQSSTEAL
jgi:hypothetical protein